jgi:hypothetical protein
LHTDPPEKVAIMDEQDASESRFARYVSPTAPKSGHQLATVSFERNGEMRILWLFEGPPNPQVSAMGMTTNFTQVSPEASKDVLAELAGLLVLPQNPQLAGKVTGAFPRHSSRHICSRA